MAAALAVSNWVHGATGTINLTGDAATTQRIIQITDPNGHSYSIPVTTNGSGAASCTYVPQVAGKYTITDQMLLSTVVSTTAQTSHI